MKYYEDDDDLMPKLRPLVLPKNIEGPFNKLMDKKLRKTFNDQGHVRAANEFLDAFLNCTSGRVVLYYIADLMQKLGLTVSYELFKQETGFDLYQVSLRHQMEEQLPYLLRPGYIESEPQIIYKLSDFVSGQNFYNKNPEMCYDRDIVSEVWDDLNLWPSPECTKRPTKRDYSEYEETLLKTSGPLTVPPKRRPSRLDRPRNYAESEIRR